VLRITGGVFKGRQLKAPKGDTTRPTTEGNREALFNIIDISLQHSMNRILDLFAGSGALTCEAFSRGAESSVLVESDRAAQKISIENIRELSPQFPYKLLSESRVERWADLLKAQASDFLPFDTVFCDPPYGKGLTQKVLDHLLSVKDLFQIETLYCFEVSKKEVLKIPSEFEIIKDRTRGDSRFFILRAAH
jgi:16S rRNA (guanine966-N2)-methyltransferase